MPSTLHITNGDTVTAGIRTADGNGDVLPWRDVLHEGPVPADLDLTELSRLRAAFLADGEPERLDELERSLADRDDTLRRFGDYDEVVLWFEWDLYDQLQLIQLLDFFSSHSPQALEETGTRLSLVCIAGYLGNLSVDRFPGLYEARCDVTPDMLTVGRAAWKAFRSGDPSEMESIARADSGALEFLPGAFTRQLEELPSTRNGLSRSESQILEAVAQRPLSFTEIFRRTANREERLFCGDVTLASYIERMSRHDSPLLTYPSGETIDAPRTEEDSSAFRNAAIALTPAGRAVLRGDSDWIQLGGSDRWLGGLHLEGSSVRWRWDQDLKRVIATPG